MKSRTLAVIPLLSLSFAAPTAAQAEGLYKVALPPGSAAVRMFNAGAAIPGGAAKFGDRRIGSLATGDSTIYYTIVAGSRPLSCGNSNVMADIEEGKFYTFVCGGPYDGSLLVDPQPTNTNKTFVILYNLTRKDPIKLATANGKLDVVKDTPLKSMGGREINPVRVEFSIFDKQNQKLFDLGQVPLAPAKVYSIFATQVAGEVRAYVHESFLASEM